MSATLPNPYEIDTDAPPHPAPADWRAGFLDDLDHVAARCRWGRALRIAGWIHLGFFAVCQGIYHVNVRGDLRYPALWVAEVVVLLVLFRRISGPGWWRASPAAGLLVRIWGTFLILTFNVATYNTLMGWELDWFKPVWTTLSTFGFATLAWLIDLRFLIFAVGMYFTGLLLIRFPHQSYAIYGASWFATLQAIGYTLEHRARRQAGL